MRFGWFTSILLIELSIAAVPVQGALGDILWTFDTGAPVFASPTLGRDGTIYLGSNAATCTALTPTSGDPVVKWTYMADDWIDATVALAEDGTLYVGTYNSTLAALDPETGQAKWEIPLGDEEGLLGIVQSSPGITSDGLIVVSTSTGVIHGIFPSGEEDWFYEFGADTRSSPAIDLEDRIYFGADDGLLRCLNASGELQWDFPVDGAGEDASRIYSSPSIDGEGNIYFGAGNGYLYSLDRNGEFRWKFETPEAVDVSPAIDEDNNVYFASRNGSIYCVNAEGEECWSKFLGDIFFSSPIIDANGFVYITYFAGQGISFVVAFAPGGEEVWQTQIDAVIDSSLVLTVDGHLLVGAFDGRLYAIESGGPLQYSAPWARFRRDTRGRGRVIEGPLPELGGEIKPLALAQGAVGLLEIDDVAGGERFAWRRRGETVAVTEEGKLAVGPMTSGDVDIYDVIISNLVGEVLSPTTVLVQLEGLRWEQPGETGGLMLEVIHPVDDRFTVDRSGNLIDWSQADLPLPSLEDLPPELRRTTIILTDNDDNSGYVRLGWEP